MNKYDRALLESIALKLRSGVESYEDVEVLEAQRLHIINSQLPMKKVKKVNKLKKAVTAKAKKVLKKKK